MPGVTPVTLGIIDPAWLLLLISIAAHLRGLCACDDESVPAPLYRYFDRVVPHATSSIAMWRTARLWSQTYVAMATRGAPMGYSTSLRYYYDTLMSILSKQ